ncbi:MAG: bifunctional phosphoribosylaminoimidazolecarboxamide formyltransferase/IMP cyclohydrolase [Acidobacteria bacterium]|nr:bifunctional phosphoribosylaminoimidazolecarboxamide formyltransferase/IMP cyclohydrolase [Acidobacteriota bacterium]
MPRALLSVSDKSGLVDFARALAERGIDLVSTGGTARALREAGLAVIGISDVTGFPEMMDGRVKTLHPLVHGGILARRDRADDLASAAAHDITLIDLVVVNLYPFVRAASDPDTPFDGLVEEIDIGGPSLVRAAAKNFKDVLVVVSPSDYAAVIEQLDRSEGPTRDFRFSLARAAFHHTGRYDTAIAATLGTVTVTPDGFDRGTPARLPDMLSMTLRKVRDLRYGENPHQPAALYQGFGTHPGFTALQGKALSYTNLLDLDAAARIAAEFQEAAAVVIKHTNPCGAATGRDPADAYVRAREADAVAAFGGIVGLNRPIDTETARAIVSTFIEAVTAPSVEADALAILATKVNLRVMVPAADDGRAGGNSAEDLEMRSIVGGVLVQARDVVREAHDAWPGDADLRVVTKRQPTPDEWQALRFAWRICAHIKSNTVMFASADRTLAVGAGQMSRVDAVQVARMKAESLGPNGLAGSVAASDAFFPFRDGLDAVAAAGATAVVQPGGSVRDGEVIEAADTQGLAMVFTGRRHFRH